MQCTIFRYIIHFCTLFFLPFFIFSCLSFSLILFFLFSPTLFLLLFSSWFFFFIQLNITFIVTLMILNTLRSTWRLVGYFKLLNNKHLPEILRLFSPHQLFPTQILFVPPPGQILRSFQSTCKHFNKSCPKHLLICHISLVESIKGALSKSAKFAKNATTYL